MAQYVIIDIIYSLYSYFFVYPSYLSAGNKWSNAAMQYGIAIAPAIWVFNFFMHNIFFNDPIYDWSINSSNYLKVKLDLWLLFFIIIFAIIFPNALLLIESLNSKYSIDLLMPFPILLADIFV